MTITIKQMIAHDLDLSKKKPLLAPDIINLTTVPSFIFDFFAKHINTSLKARQIKVSKFKQNGTFVQLKVQNIAKDITNTKEFVSSSHSITRELHSIMKATSSKSKGTLFFLIYEDGNKEYLGILKMDQNKGIQINQKTFTLDVQENMLPNPKDKLHKCAFIRLTEDFSDELVDLYVLDRQQRGDEVSLFFMDTFLKAEELINNKISTKRVISKLHDMALSIVPAEDELRFQYSVDKMFQNGIDIDLDHDLEKLVYNYIPNEVEREDFIEDFKTSLREEFEDIPFRFTVEKDPSTILFTSKEKDVKFEFPLEYLDTIIEVEDNQENKTVFTIHDIELFRKTK